MVKNKRIYNLNIFLSAISLVSVFLLLWACEKPTSPAEIGSNTENYIHLQNQTDHSDVLIKILEADKMAITDSLGHFVFPKITDGIYTLQAKYPFFKIIEQSIVITDSVLQTDIELELEQQLQFWVEPAETTLTMADKTRFWEFKGYVENISDSIISGTTYTVPENWGIIQENNNEYFRSCYYEHTKIGLTDLLGIGGFSISPGYIAIYNYKDVWQLGYECTPPEKTYLMFFILIDQIDFDEYFQGRFFVDGIVDNEQVINPLTKSLYKKHNLFRPSIIHFEN